MKPVYSRIKRGYHDRFIVRDMEFCNMQYNFEPATSVSGKTSQNIPIPDSLRHGPGL